ncbi:twin-arginine translocase TatA/TatE family subunit [Paenibacillus chitinolyticus]|uniref:twin-arginine translocase TatA/TatE family subunit n=1 Tax=Paenibacillus chitinolyticus TaxID=79263 RepID=UPI0036720672
MFQNIGFTEILLVAVVCLLLFGPNKLPELGRAFGRTLSEFKKGARDMMSEHDQADKKAAEAKSAAAAPEEVPAPASLTQAAPAPASSERAASDNPRRLPD